MAGEKCLVRHCPNTADQGEFFGPVCRPCADAIKGSGQGPAAHRLLRSATLSLKMPTVVTLCGSTRFAPLFLEVGARETLAGKIVLSIAVSKHAPRDGHGGEALGQDVADRLDALHRRKIDLSDEVLILNVCGYVGPSTQGEVLHAAATGKRLRWEYPELVPERFAGPFALPTVPPERHYDLNHLNLDPRVGFVDGETWMWCAVPECPERRPA
jgi:hypothetical protein